MITIKQLSVSCGALRIWRGGPWRRELRDGRARTESGPKGIVRGRDPRRGGDAAYDRSAGARAVKDHAWVANVARCSLIDTDAPVEALAAGNIGAALDVTDPESLPEGHPLWTEPRAFTHASLGEPARGAAPRASSNVPRITSAASPRTRSSPGLSTSKQASDRPRRTRNTPPRA